MRHDKLKHAVKTVKNCCFQYKQGKYIAIAKYEAIWVNNTNKYNISFDKKDIKLALSNLLDQKFRNVGNLPFLQTISIPRGCELVPFIANLFLFTFESKKVLQTKRSNLQKARKFANTV